jgi:hypothetical protein
MFRRMSLALACVAVVGAASFILSASAKAQGGRFGGYGFSSGYGNLGSFGSLPAGGYYAAGLRMSNAGAGFVQPVPLYGYPVNGYRRNNNYNSGYYNGGYYNGGPRFYDGGINNNVIIQIGN